MATRLTIAIGAAITVCLVVLALWSWNHADVIAMNSTRPDVLAWAVRVAAIGLAAGAQVILLTFVVARVYGRDFLLDAARVSGGLVVVLAGVSAVALGLAGR